MRDYLRLTKPTILLLVAITGAAGLVLESSLTHQPVRFLLVLLGLMLAGGSANAFNMYFEREIDARMSRTKTRRPLPMGRITPRHALYFAIAIGIAGVALFTFYFNLFSGLLASGTIAFYAFFYTLWLKPNTPYNIVIGGAAGSMGPVIAWAAATGSLSLAPLLLFLIIFLWTPPHFWALALHFKDDYRAAGLPMMPVVRGDKATKRQIIIYAIAVVVLSLTLKAVGAGLVYFLAAIALGIIFIFKSVKINLGAPRRSAMSAFTYSIIYLLLLFTLLMVDAAWNVRL